MMATNKYADLNKGARDTQSLTDHIKEIMKNKDKPCRCCGLMPSDRGLSEDEAFEYGGWHVTCGVCGKTHGGRHKLPPGVDND